MSAAAEIERPVRHERPAEAPAHDVPDQAHGRIAERIVRGQRMMPQEIGQRAVPLVAAGFRHDVDEAAVGAAGLHAQTAGADLELLDGLERDGEVLPFERSEELAEEVVREVGAIDVQREVVARLTGDSERAPRAGDGSRGRRQQGEVAVVAPIDGQTRESIGVERRAERRRGVARRRNRHGLGQRRRSASRRSRRGPGRRSTPADSLVVAEKPARSACTMYTPSGISGAE